MTDLSVKLEVIACIEDKNVLIETAYVKSFDSNVTDTKDHIEVLYSALDAFTNIVIRDFNVLAINKYMLFVVDVVSEKNTPILVTDLVRAMPWIDKVINTSEEGEDLIKKLNVCSSYYMRYTDTECMKLVQLDKTISLLKEGVDSMNNNELKEASVLGEGSAEGLSNKSLKTISASADKKPMIDVISDIIGHLKITAISTEKKINVNYQALIDNLVDYRAKYREAMNADGEEKITFLKKIGYAIVIGFVKTAEILLGVAKFTLDLVAILGMFAIGVAKSVGKEACIAGQRVGNSFNNNIKSLFTETEFKSIVDITTK